MPHLLDLQARNASMLLDPAQGSGAIGERSTAGLSGAKMSSKRKQVFQSK